MTDATAAPDTPKPSKLPLILGVTLALLGGGGGFYAVYSGMILGGESHLPMTADAHEHGGHGEGDVGHDSELAIAPAPLGDVVFVPLDPLVISLAPTSHSRHLKFRAQLEVVTGTEAEVQALSPRVIDVLNSYLRAIEPADLENPAILARLRAQMLRRVQVVAGADRVRDLLIMEFVLN